MKHVMQRINKQVSIAIIGALAAGTVLIALLVLKPWEIKLSEVCTASVSSEKNLIAVGESVSFELQFTMLDEEKTEKIEKELKKTVFVWTSSDESVATVDENGRVTGKAPGTASIHVEGGGLAAEYPVNVYRKLEDVILSKTELIANVGEVVQLTYELKPSDAGEIGAIFWTSLDPMIAEVAEDGTVTMKAPGTTQIKLSAGGFELTCEVTVYAPLNEIQLNAEKLDLIDGETAQLSVSMDPANTTDDTTARWSSTDEAVVTVDGQGLVTAIEPGSATITVQVGEFSKTCEVTVTAPMTEFVIRVSDLTMRRGDATTLPVTIEPVNTTDDKAITWTSSNANIVSVNAAGKVTAVNAGTATIRAVCGEFVSECRITVIIPVTSVSISQTSATLNKGETLNLTASVGPSNTTEDRSISWTSDNASVATVKNGVVTAVGPGTAKIIASHGDYSANCTVTVFSPMAGIELEQKKLSVIEGYTGNLSVLFFPVDTTDDRSTFWSSSDETIATVKSGVVTGVAVGTCEITATCGAFSVTCQVTVLPFVEVESVTLDIVEWNFEETGATKKLSAQVLPADASFGSVSFSSSDPAVATVSADGVVTGVSEGTAVITATAGGKTATCTVTVPKPDVVIVLDPGHGGKFPGASYFGYNEKNLNLKVALYCRQYLEENYKGLKVYMTREGDYHLLDDVNKDLEARAQFAQDKGASILVSFHFNASYEHKINGCLVISSHRANVKAQCEALSNSILAQLVGLGIKNKGILIDYSTDYFDKDGNALDGYAINRHSANRGIPGIIVEHCYIDSATDKRFFDSEEALRKLGIADAIGIANYLGLEKK